MRGCKVLAGLILAASLGSITLFAQPGAVVYEGARLIIGDAAQSLASKMNLKVALLTDKTISGGQAIAMPKGETALKAEVDRIIGEMQKDGTMKKLQDQAGVP